jgi:hypothetical protein
MSINWAGESFLFGEECEREGWLMVGLVIALRPQTSKHIRCVWSHYTDTSEPVDGKGAQNMVTVQSGFEPATFWSLAHELTNCSNWAPVDWLLNYSFYKAQQNLHTSAWSWRKGRSSFVRFSNNFRKLKVHDCIIFFLLVTCLYYRRQNVHPAAYRGVMAATPTRYGARASVARSVASTGSLPSMRSSNSMGFLDGPQSVRQ